jgi:hypothetical protein
MANQNPTNRLTTLHLVDAVSNTHFHVERYEQENGGIQVRTKFCEYDTKGLSEEDALKRLRTRAEEFIRALNTRLPP